MYLDLMRPPDEKRARFRALTKQGKLETGRQYEQRRGQLELPFDRQPERRTRQPGTSR